MMDKLRTLQPEKYDRSDKGNGQLFADLYEDCLRFNVTAKEWYYFDGIRWIEDSGGMYAGRKAKELSDSLIIYSASLADETVQKEYLKYVARLGSRRIRCAMIDDAKDWTFIRQEDLDRDLYLLNCQNGILDLKTFKFFPHSSKYLMSKVCNAVYDPAAGYDAWQTFIEEVLEGDREKIRYLQKILGLSLTGDTKEETCWLLYGPTTRNGKSTLVETFSYMLGNSDGYALNMRPETLAQKQNTDSRQATGDIARLDGCRFLNASEPPKRMVFDTALLKNLLGRDTITARHLHQREFQFVPVFKLVINTNYLPLITDNTLFTSGRLNVITFNKHFCEEDQDRGLKDRLRETENISGLLNWCLEGLELYYTEGLNAPSCVVSATEDYRSSSDKIGIFITECLIESSENCTVKEAYDSYTDWCRDNGFGTENKSNFTAELRGKGLYAAQGTVHGKTCKNIIRGYIVSAFEPVPENMKVPFD